MYVLENLHICCCRKIQRVTLKNGVSQKDHQTPHGPCHSQGYQDPFPQGHPEQSAHCAVVASAKGAHSKEWSGVWGVFSAQAQSSCPLWKRKYRQDVICFRSRAAFQKTKQKTAGDTSEVRSNMKVHRCHRLHTEKEERVMFSLVSAYLIWSLKSMPRQTYICSQSSIL